MTEKYNYYSKQKLNKQKNEKRSYDKKVPYEVKPRNIHANVETRDSFIVQNQNTQIPKIS